PFADDAPVGIKGGFSFANDPTSPLTPADAPIFASANLASANPTSFSQTIPPVLTSVPTAQTSYFVTDDYSGIQNLTLSLGLRYDREFGSFDEHINPAAFAQPVPFLGDPSQRGDKNNFGPRLGLSWNIHGDGKDIVRAGYGIYYNNLQTLQNFSEDRNFAQSVVSITCSKPGQAGCPSYPSAFANGQTAATVLPTVTVLAPNYQNPYSQQYNLGY